MVPTKILLNFVVVVSLSSLAGQSASSLTNSSLSNDNNDRLTTQNDLPAASSPRNEGGRILSPGQECIACTGLVALYEQWQTLHTLDCGEPTLHDFCSMLPDIFGLACHALARVFGAHITTLLCYDGETPDVVCAALTFCNATEEGDTFSPQCTLYPQQQQKSAAFFSKYRSFRQEMKKHLASLNFPTTTDDINFDICTIPVVSTMCTYIQGISSLHRPFVDPDDDGFSSVVETLRGYAWRGRDCNDALNFVHPGRQPLLGDVSIDSNCNGIHGYDWRHLKTYENEFCSNTSAQRGIIMLGDSATAHAHIPWEFLNATMLSADTLRNLSFIVENEFDFPHLSFGTGFVVQSDWPIVHGPTDSIYLRLRERNLCNHRDYQNIGVNGAYSKSAMEFVQSLSRDPDKDKPAIVFFAYIGNDVCNSWFDTLSHDTHVKMFQHHLNRTLDYLQTRLPANSHVVVMDLVDARFLYDSMHNRTHPLGALRNDVTFRNFYDYMNCLDMNPCRGWLTSNDTLRQLTLHRVTKINRGILAAVAANQGLHSQYQLHHMTDPIGDVFRAWIAQGGELWQLVEPADGFHPNQYCNSVIGSVLWQKLLLLGEDIVGPINPFNDVIVQIFGDQGGH